MRITTGNDKTKLITNINENLKQIAIRRSCYNHHKKKKRYIWFRIANVEILATNTKHFEVYFDTLGNFKEHFERATGRAVERSGRLISNIAG